MAEAKRENIYQLHSL